MIRLDATDLQGRTFFVTGANSGIGRALVEALAARGGAVVLETRSEQRTKPVLSAIQTRYPGARDLRAPPRSGGVQHLAGPAAAAAMVRQAVHALE